MLTVAFVVLAAGLILAVIAQIAFGPSPLKRLRRALASLRVRRQCLLEGVWPREMQPLADGINVLLEHAAIVLARTRRQAADLAHALKAPLAVIANEAARSPCCHSRDWTKRRRERPGLSITSEIAGNYNEISTSINRRREACASRWRCPRRLALSKDSVPMVLHSVVAALSSAPSPWTADAATLLPRVEWPYGEALVRLALALSLGLLIGLERERHRKEAGIRTFAFTALLGALGGSLGESYALATLALTGLLIVFLNLQTLRSSQGTELTTSAALLITCAAGILCGQGHRLTPAAVTVITTALLAWKQSLAGFTMGLTEKEVRSAVTLAILAIVIYPALPQGSIGPWGVIEPRAAWLTVLLIAGIGFVNYVLWKLYNTRGTEIAGFLGGLVNSSVTVHELASRVAQSDGRIADTAYRAILLATAAMVMRNAILLGILAPEALISSLLPHVAMLTACGAFAAASYGKRASELIGMSEAGLALPFSLWTAIKYGALFLLLHVLGVIAQRYAGEYGFYAVSLAGGLVSSASAVAAAASQVSSESLSVHAAGVGAVIASLTSVLVNVPFAVRANNRSLTCRLTIAMCAIATVGFAATAIPVP